MADTAPLADRHVVPLDIDTLRVAIVHPFLIAKGGGEKVIDALADMFPRAEFFTLLLAPDSLSPHLRGRKIHASLLNRLPFAHRFYQHLSPFYDLAASLHDLRGFDLVISSGGPGAKTALVEPGTLHLHYCHSPVRFLWDQFPEWMRRIPRLLRPVFAASALVQRERDFNAAQRVDAFIANSDFIGRRIEAYYRRDSVTIYPPVELAADPHDATPGDYYLTVGRLVPGKRTELLIEACTRLGRKLVVVGGGPEEDRLSKIAGPGIALAGRVDDAALDRLYRHARAFLFAAEEDFGIVTVEAQSYGLPAIALAKGGSLEILTPVVDGVGDAVLFDEQSIEAVVDAIERFEAIEQGFDRAAIRAGAARFSKARFVADMRAYVTVMLAQHRLATSQPE